MRAEEAARAAACELLDSIRVASQRCRKACRRREHQLSRVGVKGNAVPLLEHPPHDRSSLVIEVIVDQEERSHGLDFP